MAGSLLAKGERWISQDTLILLSSCTKSAGEPLLHADLQSGFADAKCFCKVFRQVTGWTPNAYPREFR